MRSEMEIAKELEMSETAATMITTARVAAIISKDWVTPSSRSRPWYMRSVLLDWNESTPIAASSSLIWVLLW